MAKMSANDYVVDGDNQFRVSPRVYTDGRIFVDEMRDIFERTWVFIAHESEVPKRGDFKSTFIGQRPIVVVRDKTENINAFFNICPHRGAALCREQYGNYPVIVCPYHAWSFKTSGECLKIPDEGRYPAGFREGMHLIPVPRVENYGGLIFGCLNAEVEALESFLGDARYYIDAWNARAAGGKFKLGYPNKYSYAGNWKLQSENVVDGYHPQVVHSAAFNAMAGAIMAKEKSEAGQAEGGSVEARPGAHYAAWAKKDVGSLGLTRAFRNGHSTLESGIMFESARVSAEVSQVWIDRIREINGEDMAPDVILNRHLFIFPNLALMDFVLRAWYPVAVDRTETYSYALRNEAIDEALDVGRHLEAQTQYSASGAVAPDDADIFNSVQSAAMTDIPQGLDFSRGLGTESAGRFGELVGAISDEVPQRAFWREWATKMAYKADRTHSSSDGETR